MTEPKVVPEIPIEGITRLGRVVRNRKNRHECKSRPGHLIHLLEKGSYQLTTNGRTYLLRKGDMIYYHDGEDVIWHEGGTAVTFITAGFFAPCLEPPPLDKRKFRSTPVIEKAFRRAVSLSQKTASQKRDFLIYASLFEMLGSLPWELGQPGKTDPAANLWWEIERWLRTEKAYRVSLGQVSERFRKSLSTIGRSCRKATGLSPTRRIQALRMEEARGLLAYSNRNVSEVADYLGYGRVHEFSREFSGYFNTPPSQMM